MTILEFLDGITYNYFNHFFIILISLVGGIFIIKCFIFKKNNILFLKNFDLLRNIFLKSLLTGFGVYSSIALILSGIYSGLLEKWPEFCPPQFGGGLLIVAGMVFLIYILQYAYEFIKISIDKHGISIERELKFP